MSKSFFVSFTNYSFVYLPFPVPKFAKVKKWTSCEVNEFIFVWYHAEGIPPSWQLERSEQIESGEWWYRGRSEFLINSHIEVIIVGFLSE